MYIDTAKNTEADLLIPGNILHAGESIISYKTPQEKTSQEIIQNLLISTNESDYNCQLSIFPGIPCGVQSSSAITIWLPYDIPGISNFHQINSSHIVVIPLDQHCLHIFERIFDKLTTKDIIGDCYSRGNRDGSNPLFDSPSQSLSDNRNREILYVMDQENEKIRMVNIADRMTGSLGLQLRFTDKYSQITQAENATFYISVKNYENTIMSLDLIPPKNASSKYFLTFKQLSYKIQHVSSFSQFFRFSKVRQMTWISNHTLVIMERRIYNERRLLKFLNFSAQTHGYINMYSSLLASFAIDKNMSRLNFEYPIFYTWVNNSIYITSRTSTYWLTRQQLQFAISNQDHHTDIGFHWQTSKYCEGRGKEGRLSIEMLELILSKPLLISNVHIPKALSHSSPSLTSVSTCAVKPTEAFYLGIFFNSVHSSYCYYDPQIWCKRSIISGGKT